MSFILCSIYPKQFKNVYRGNLFGAQYQELICVSCQHFFGVTPISQAHLEPRKYYRTFQATGRHQQWFAEFCSVLLFFTTTITCKIYRQFTRFHWISWFESLTLLFGCFQKDKYQIKFLARRLGTRLQFEYLISFHPNSLIS